MDPCGHTPCGPYQDARGRQRGRVSRTSRPAHHAAAFLVLHQSTEFAEGRVGGEDGGESEHEEEGGTCQNVIKKGDMSECDQEGGDLLR